MILRRGACLRRCTASKRVRITSEEPQEVVAALKQERGKDIWLLGGGELFRTLLDAGLVDTVERIARSTPRHSEEEIRLIFSAE